jgi:2-dehydro-3-deoxyphosphogluconate aldolase/(4S)-4-hydroxy-2-oxoglutarate aldolase
MKKAAEANMPGMLLGIGTIKNKEQALQFIEAEADYIVSPSMNKKVAAVAREEELLWMPGCMTPTELAAAERAGASIVKIFPANVLGPGFISAVKEVFPGLLFMPSSGVDLTEANLRSWFDVGVSAVGMGSKLISKNLMENQDYQAIEESTKHAIALIKNLNITS